MKIIIVGTAYPYRGGLAAFNERLATEFLREGHEVEIYTFTLQYPNFLFPGKTQYSAESAPKNLKIYRKVNSINPFNWLKIGREIRRKKPDLVIMKFWIPFIAPCLGTVARQIRKNRHTKIISILDNIIPHEKRLGDKLLAQYFVNSTDAFVAMSKSVLEDLSLFNKNKPAVFAPHPIFDHYGKIQSSKFKVQNSKTVLFFGFIRDYKGLDLLMEAFADRRFRTMGVKLVVAGEFYSNEQYYKDLEKKLGLQGEIIWSNDFIPDSKVADYFNASDIVAQPYKTATQSGVTQIAYHFEKPMLVTNVGGLAEIVPNGKVGYVVEPNPQEIADALVDFFENNPDFSEDIKLEKEKYSWKKMTQTIVNLSTCH